MLHHPILKKNWNSCLWLFASIWKTNKIGASTPILMCCAFRNLQVARAFLCCEIPCKFPRQAYRTFPSSAELSLWIRNNCWITETMTIVLESQHCWKSDLFIFMVTLFVVSPVSLKSLAAVEQMALANSLSFCGGIWGRECGTLCKTHRNNGTLLPSMTMWRKGKGASISSWLPFCFDFNFCVVF